MDIDWSEMTDEELLAAAENAAGLELGTQRKLVCTYCDRLTNHVLKASHQAFFIEPGDPQCHWEVDDYRFWVCMGCDGGKMEHAYTEIDRATDGARRAHENGWDPVLPHELDYGDEQQWHGSKYYPVYLPFQRDPKVFERLSEKLNTIYREIIASFNTELLVLCTVGLRSLMEGICDDRGIKGRNLEQKIDGLAPHLPLSIIENLHSFRFMGNIAAHELEAADWSDLSLAIDVVEDLLNYLYELDYKASQLPNFDRQKARSEGLH